MGLVVGVGLFEDAVQVEGREWPSDHPDLESELAITKDSLIALHAAKPACNCADHRFRRRFAGRDYAPGVK